MKPELLRRAPYEMEDKEALAEIRNSLVARVQIILVDRLFGVAEVAIEELAFPDWPPSEVNRLYQEAVAGLQMADIIKPCSDEEMAEVDPSRRHLKLWRLVDQDMFESPESSRFKWYTDLTDRYPRPDGNAS